MAKRLLAPHLFPLAEASPWQAAKQDVAAADAAPANKDGAPSAPVPLRKPRAFIHRLAHHWLLRLGSLLQYGLSSENNSVEIFFDGDLAFESMFAAIAQAHERVMLETFMWKPDRIGLRMIEELEAAAGRGAQVLVLYDSAGSFSLYSHHLAKLAAHPNAHIVAFNPILGSLFWSTGKDLSHRTHRKILVADSVGFAGGMNTSEQYAGPRLGINEFRDTHARITGPAVEHLAEVFYQSLQEAHAHDKATWRAIWAGIRTRTANRITSSTAFTRALEMLSETRTPAGQKASLFFQRTRDKQRAKMEQLREDEEKQAEIAAQLMGPAATSTDANAASDASSSSVIVPAHRHSSPPSARASLRQLRQFVGGRLRVLAQSSASAKHYAQFEAVRALASRQWKEAWRRAEKISRTARGASGLDKAGNGNGSSADQSSLASNQPSLPSSALSALTASLTTSPVRTPKHTASAPVVTSDSAASSPTSVASTPDLFSPVFLQILPSNTLRGQFSIHHALLDLLDSSLSHILLTNPFLLPPLGIKRAIQRAGARGVAVRLIVGGKSDTPFMRWSSSHVYHEFLALPCIEIFEYQPRILHAKTLTVDGLFSAVGSFNLDWLSSHKLLEINVAMLSAPLAKRMESQFELDLQSCVRVTKESLGQRNLGEKILHWAAYHVSRFVYSIMK